MLMLIMMLRYEIIAISLENIEVLYAKIVISRLKLNYKIHIVFHNLKNYGLHLIIQELGRFNFKINVIPNGLEKYMIFDISDKLVFSESFQF